MSIPSNIAEGAARNTTREFMNYLHMAQGSLSELDTQLELSVTLGHLAANKLALVEPLMVRLDKLLSGLIRSLRLRPRRSER